MFFFWNIWNKKWLNEFIPLRIDRLYMLTDCMNDGFTLLHAVGSSHYDWPFSRMFSLIFSMWPSFDLVRALAFFLSVPVRTHTSAEWFIYGTTSQPPLFFLFQTYTFAFALFVSIPPVVLLLSFIHFCPLNCFFLLFLLCFFKLEEL